MKAFEQNIRKVEPYVPGEQPQRRVIKLKIRIRLRRASQRRSERWMRIVCAFIRIRRRTYL